MKGIIDKPKRQLLNELAEMHQYVAEIRILEPELQQVTEALHESEEFGASLLKNSPNPIYVISPDTTIRYVNPALEKLTGFSSRELIGRKPPYPWWTEETLDKIRRDFVEAIHKGASKLEELFQKKNRERFWAEITLTLIRSNGTLRYYLVNWIDITERKQAEERIRHAAEEWRTTFDSIADLVSIHDKDFRLVRVNKAYADTFKAEPKELIGKICYEVFHGTKKPVPNCPYKQILKTKKPITVEVFEPLLGGYFQISASPMFDDRGEVVGCVHIAKDITKRKLSDGKLIITDRLASVGELASGIAHELNNPLTSVIGFAKLLLDRDIPDDIKEDVQIIASEAQRTADVVKNLLTFARQHSLLRQPININSVIEKVLKLRTYEQRVNNIRVNTHFDPELPEIMADYFQLQQVFLNIIINAEYFMIEAHRRGTLTIITERTQESIRASLTDDGPGITKANMGHLFDPFFTTKEVGKGTGLGLSICHGIITEHGGRLYAESEPGQGTTFVIELPISRTVTKKGGAK